ncbi:Gfo/Idh/MocA family protein [Amorphoplanes digitatis]|uniref:Putative dehydrogenase n=1 Tax=Actinoplanes digitatis TaxID=1868 RepID=A0A7W7HVL9_9ACTN|nr:Gfo/Idh/MocA family oxidoreductase [Actinoplanes digitatis]MBB4761607.1 putative dehydrogenase [Actinoplanes digitatis]GID90717.1 dehydrogenase [Actinoplanes digitatis]
MTGRPRSGIIGPGFIGEVHARAVRAAGGVLAAVAGHSPESSAAAATRLLAERAAPSAEELVESDDVDVVHICTPNHLHAPLAERAMAAGKHVICEKPLSTDLDGARRLAKLAAAAPTVTAVPFVYRFYPTVRDARGRVRRGDLGSLHLLHGSYLQDWLSRPEDHNWRVDASLGGGSRAFGDIGVHWCDVVEFTTGHRIARLVARMMAIPRGNDRPARGTEDAAAVLFETDRGALGSLVVSQISPGRKNRLWFSLDGAGASAQFDQELPDALWVGSREQNALVPRGGESSTGDAARYNIVPVGHPQGYLDCFTAFVADVYAATAGDTPDGLPTFDDGLRAAVVTDAVLTSARGGGWVDVP